MTDFPSFLNFTSLKFLRSLKWWDIADWVMSNKLAISWTHRGDSDKTYIILSLVGSANALNIWASSLIISSLYNPSLISFNSCKSAPDSPHIFLLSMVNYLPSSPLIRWYHWVYRVYYLPFYWIDVQNPITYPIYRIIPSIKASNTSKRMFF